MIANGLDGANVHVSMVGFDDGAETCRQLDDKAVASINSNLTAHADVTGTRKLTENSDIVFKGDPERQVTFDITDERALEMLRLPNPHGRPNSDVIVPWVNGLDVTRRSRGMFIIDFRAPIHA